MFVGYIGHSENSTFNASLKTAFEDKFYKFQKQSLKSVSNNFSFIHWTTDSSASTPPILFENDFILLMLIGVQFDKSHFDFDIFTKHYEKHGIQCINTLSGEYAGVLLDKKKNTSFFFKDHLGTTPISLYKNDDGVVFCSNERVLSSLIQNRNPLSKNYLESLFYSFAPNYSISPNSSFIKVLGGSYVEYNAFENVKYWHLTDIPIKKSITREEVITTLSSLLEKSMMNRIESTGNRIGVHISGGLDSALIAGKLNQFKKEKTIVGFSWSPPYAEFSGDTLEYDERDHVTAISDHLHIRTLFTSYQKSDLINDINDWEHPIDFPFERNLISNAKIEKVNTLFTGFGGDEFIGLQNAAFLHFLFKKGKWKTFFKFNQNTGIVNSAKFILNEGIFPRRRRPMLTKKYSDKILRYMKPGADNSANGKYNLLCRSPQHYIQSMIESHHIEARCEQWYNLWITKGVRYSHALLDRSIVEFCYSIPAHIFYEKIESKTLIRELAGEFASESMIKMDRTLDPALFSNSEKVDLDALPELVAMFKAIDVQSYFNFIDINKLKIEIDNFQEMNEEKKRELIYVLKYLLTSYSLIKELNQ